MRQITAFAVSFRRRKPPRGSHKADGWELGLYVGQHESDENAVIFDLNGKIVEPYEWWPHEGSLVLQEHDE
jgi:hypothetical protein